MTEHIINNTKFRVIETFSNTTMERSAAFMIALSDYGNPITKKDNIDAWEELKNIMATPLPSREQDMKIGALAGTMQLLLNLRDPIKSTLNLAYTFILLEDEPEDKISAKHLKEKMQLVEADVQVRNFFLSRCVHLLQAMSVLSKDTRPEDFLKDEQHQLEQSLLKKIGSNLYRG